VAFSRRLDGATEIVVVDVDATPPTERVVVTAPGDPGPPGLPSWSPDGQRLTYIGAADGAPEVYLVDLDGTHGTRLTYNHTLDLFPAWGPGGIAHTHRGSLVVTDPESGTSQVVVRTEAEAYLPAWSPDGTTLVFAGRG
jgi:TolB protein